MLDKIKQYGQYILELLLLIATGAFLYEKAKKDTAEAQVAEEETVKQVAAVQKQVDVNQAQLSAEEQKRAEIKKEADDAKSNNDDPSTFLNKR